jgi:hypothetical protein
MSANPPRKDYIEHSRDGDLYLMILRFDLISSFDLAQVPNFLDTTGNEIYHSV